MSAPSKGSPNEHQGGFALIVVLWIVTLLALEVSIFNLTIRDAGTLAGNELAIARGEALASAGVEYAAAELMKPQAARLRSVDGSVHEMRFGGALLHIKITDEAARFDLNQLDEELAAALLQPYGRSAEALQKWKDRNGPFLDPSELADALGLPASALRALMRHLTVHGGDGKINPLAASRETLLLLPGINVGDVDRVLAMRRGGMTMSATEIARALGSAGKWLTERAGPAYRVEVAVQGESGPAIGWVEAVILIGGDNEAPFRVLRWRYEPGEHRVHQGWNEQ